MLSQSPKGSFGGSGHVRGACLHGLRLDAEDDAASSEISFAFKLIDCLFGSRQEGAIHPPTLQQCLHVHGVSEGCSLQR